MGESGREGQGHCTEPAPVRLWEDPLEKKKDAERTGGYDVIQHEKAEGREGDKSQRQEGGGEKTRR